jgi:hypothetical protein
MNPCVPLPLSSLLTLFYPLTCGKVGGISVTAAHGQKGRVVMDFQGYTTKAEETMHKQMIKVLQLHFAKHPQKLSTAFGDLAYRGFV